jgi:hypothetical protein
MAAFASLLAPSTSSAQSASYATVDELPREPAPLFIDVSNALRYQRVLDPGRAGPTLNVFEFALRARVGVGARVAYFAGLDASVGGAESGGVYSLSAQLAGIGVRWGDASAAQLGAGVGVSAIGAAVPVAARVPLELSVAQSAGPLRFRLWAQTAWVFGNEARKAGAPLLSFVDELEAGLSVRVGRQHRYWGSHSGGAGPSLTVQYREFMGARSIGFSLGFDLAGAR